MGKLTKEQKLKLVTEIYNLVNREEHSTHCSAHSEGQECCLEKNDVVENIISIIENL